MSPTSVQLTPMSSWMFPMTRWPRVRLHMSELIMLVLTISELWLHFPHIQRLLYWIVPKRNPISEQKLQAVKLVTYFVWKENWLEIGVYTVNDFFGWLETGLKDERQRILGKKWVNGSKKVSTKHVTLFPHMNAPQRGSTQKARG